MSEEKKVATAVIVGTRLGSGIKMHITEALVKNEIRFGKNEDVYRVDSVECGSSKWSGWGRSGQWGIIELIDRVEVEGIVFPTYTHFSTSFLRVDFAAQILEVATKNFGENLCSKCEKRLVRLVEIQKKKLDV